MNKERDRERLDETERKRGRETREEELGGREIGRESFFFFFFSQTGVFIYVTVLFEFPIFFLPFLCGEKTNSLRT